MSVLTEEQIRDANDPGCSYIALPSDLLDTVADLQQRLDASHREWKHLADENNKLERQLAELRERENERIAQAYERCAEWASKQLITGARGIGNSPFRQWATAARKGKT